MKKFLLLVTFLAFTGLTFAGTTGGLVGKVTTEDGTGLPGVTIIAKSPSLQGQKSTTTDANGKYRLILLPPGVYEITFSMPSFQTITRKGIKVMLDTNLTINQVMKADKLEESIVVTAEQPLIDSTTTTVGQNYTTDYVESIPTGRSYTSVMNLTPGVTGSDGTSGGMVVAGASGTESTYIIDGMNTTDVELGTQGKGLNFDFVEEVQVKTGGYEAEFGQSMGAVVNVITKSGGNEFSGSAFYYWRNPSYSATAPTPWFGTTFIGTKEYDYGFSLGGPIIKDKLWFFLAYNPSVTENHYQTHEAYIRYRNESTTISKVERDYWALKLTYNINENHTVVFSAFGDPTDTTSRDASGTFDGDRFTTTGGTDFTVKYDGILNENFVISAQFATHEQEIKDRALNGNDLPAQYWLGHAEADLGGIGYTDNTDMQRDQYKVALEWFLGSHDIKVGLDYQDNTFDSGRRYSGGAVYRIYGYYDDNGDGINDSVDIRRRMFALDNANGELYNYDGSRFTQLHDFLQNETQTLNTSFFIQDKWNVTDSLLLSYGVRWEKQEIKGSHPMMGGEFTAIDIDDNIAPRIGFTYDVFGDGTSKLYGSWGTFYESIPMDINNRAFAQEVLFFDWWYLPARDVDANGDGVINAWDFNPDNYNLGYTAGTDDPYRYFSFASGAGGPAPVSDNLNGTSHDEFIIGYDYLLSDLWSVGVKFTYKSLNDIVEDISFDDGNHYILANPGNDIIYTDSNGNDIVVTAEESGFKKPVRNYRAYELQLKRKFADNWQMNFSYIHSKLWGDYIGGVLPFYGQTDPNLTAAYDLPSTLVNTSGVLPFDRTHQVKIDGVYQFDFGMSLGFQYTYYSGTPIAAYGEPDDGTTGWYGEFRLITNGAPGLGRTDAIQSLDLNLSYTYDLGKYGSLTGYFYIFNVFNFDNVTAVNQRITYDTPSESWLAENGMTFREWASWIDGRFKDLTELKSFMDEAGMEVYENFLKPEGYQTPRYIRFGLKYKF